MFLKHLLVGLFELVLMTFMCGLLIYIIYRVFIKATPEIDMEKELKNGNVAVGILVASIMVSAGIMVQKGLVASVGMFQMSLLAPSEFTLPVWQTALVILGHLILSLAVAVFVLSVTLRLFIRLVRKINPELRPGTAIGSGKYRGRPCPVRRDVHGNPLRRRRRECLDQGAGGSA